MTATCKPAFKQIASGLRFPEGPVAMPDGSVVLVEIERRTLSRVTPDGKIHVIAALGGGPNGAAMGPGGKVYVTNNGGLKFVERPGKLFPVLQADDYSGGSIQVVDPETGRFETLYDRCDGRRLRGPASRLRARRLDGLGGDIAPQVVEPVEVARVGREHVQHDVEVVGDDPRRLALACDGTRQQGLVALQHRVHLVPDRLRLPRVVPGRDDEVVGVAAHRLHVHDDDVSREFLLCERRDAACLFE